MLFCVYHKKNCPLLETMFIVAMLNKEMYLRIRKSEIWSKEMDVSGLAALLKCYAKNSIYIYYALGNRYGFSISVQPGIDCTTFHSFFS